MCCERIAQAPCGMYLIERFNKTGTVRITTLRQVRVTIVAVEKQLVLHIVCVCNLRHPACNAHAPYCRLWPVWLCTICPTLSHATARFSGKSYCVLTCFTNIIGTMSDSNKK